VGAFESFLQDWGYLGIFVGIVLTGIGFPMPEELPIVIGGALVGGEQANFLMLPLCILGVMVGDSFLYGIGRIWGVRLLESEFVKKRILPPARLDSIRENFQKFGVKILLFARLTPGIRAPIFMTAGITKMPLYQFMLADGIYAIPGVSLLFFLGYFFTERMVTWIKTEGENLKFILILLALLGVAGYFAYRFLRRPMVTGDPKDVPPIIQPMQHTLEQMAKMTKMAIINPAESDGTVKPDEHQAVGEGPVGDQTGN
jgi:membrane protein DedA with SNARE-associated domain